MSRRSGLEENRMTEVLDDVVVTAELAKGSGVTATNPGCGWRTRETVDHLIA